MNKTEIITLENGQVIEIDKEAEIKSEILYEDWYVMMIGVNKYKVRKAVNTIWDGEKDKAERFMNPLPSYKIIKSCNPQLEGTELLKLEK